MTANAKHKHHQVTSQEVQQAGTSKKINTETSKDNGNLDAIVRGVISDNCQSTDNSQGIPLASQEAQIIGTNRATGPRSEKIDLNNS